jgi:hypothetical protein
MSTPSSIPADIGKMHVPFLFPTMPLNWIYAIGLCRAEPLASMFLKAVQRPSPWLNYLFSPKRFLDTFCNGPYSERFLCKSVSRWLLLYRPLSNYISSDIYYLEFPNDPLQRKLLVYAVYTIELVQAILLARVAYVEFAAGFGNFQAINTIGLLSLAVPILCSIGMCFSFSWPCMIGLLTSKLVTAVVQIFYAYRIKLLADSYLIPSVVTLVNFVFLHFEWLSVSIWIVRLGSTRRRDRRRYNWDTDFLFLQLFGQEDIDSYGCMCSKFSLEPLAIWPIFIDLEW